MQEHSQILGIITINGTDSEYVKYTFDQILELIQYAGSQNDVKSIIIHGYENIDGDKKVIVFPKQSTISYAEC